MLYDVQYIGLARLHVALHEEWGGGLSGVKEGEMINWLRTTCKSMEKTITKKKRKKKVWPADGQDGNQVMMLALRLAHAGEAKLKDGAGIKVWMSMYGADFLVECTILSHSEADSYIVRFKDGREKVPDLTDHQWEQLGGNGAAASPAPPKNGAATSKRQRAGGARALGAPAATEKPAKMRKVSSEGAGPARSTPQRTQFGTKSPLPNRRQSPRGTARRNLNARVKRSQEHTCDRCKQLEYACDCALQRGGVTYGVDPDECDDWTDTSDSDTDDDDGGVAGSGDSGGGRNVPGTSNSASTGGGAQQGEDAAKVVIKPGAAAAKIALEAIDAQKLVMFSVDFETTSSGPGGYPFQLSAIAWNPFENDPNEPRFKGTVLGTFNEYCTVPEDAEWNMLGAAASHGVYGSSDARLKGKDSLKVVFKRFLAFFETHLKKSGKARKDDKVEKVGCFVAWNGAACEATHLHRLIDDRYKEDASIDWPRGLTLFWDPRGTCKKAGCSLNVAKSCPNPDAEHDTGYSCQAVYCRAMSTPANNVEGLEGEHDSLVDCKAQLKIISVLTHLNYVFTKGADASQEPTKKMVDNTLWTQFTHKTNAVTLFSDVVAKKQAKLSAQIAERERPVVAGWTLRDTGADDDWAHSDQEVDDPPINDIPAAGPKGDAMTVNNFKDLWELMFPDSLYQTIAEETERYGNKEWVRDANDGGWVTDDDSGEDSDDEDDNGSPADDEFGGGSAEVKSPHSRNSFQACKEKDDGARHRYNNKNRKWVTPTVGMLKTYHAILIYAKARGTRCVTDLWCETHNLGAAWVRNAMTRDSFLQVRVVVVPHATECLMMGAC